MKKKILNILVLSVAIILLSIVAINMRNFILEKNDDEVVLRFAVTSKTFVFDETNEGLSNFISCVYDYSESQEYKNVDAFIVNGHITGDETDEAFMAVEVIASDYLNSGSKLFSIEEDKHVKIKGYDFILMSSDYESYAGKFNWIDNALAECTKYNEKPVFVFQYSALRNTFYGTETWYTHESEQLMNIFEKYPTLIDFASGALTPANTSRSIAHKNATYVNSGAVSSVRYNYSEYGYDTSNEIINETSNKVSQCKVVEVYGDGRVCIKTMDLRTGGIYDDYFNDICTFDVDTINNTGYDDIPVFGEETFVEVLVEENGLLLSFDVANDMDGILFYNIIVYDSNDNELLQYNSYSDFALYEKNLKKTVKLNNVDKTLVKKIVITPYDIYGYKGSELIKELEN